ncbi:MAG TPA: hypothetical protein VK772_00005 [Puia sp.]|jgi:hypothetical protein|nr:hypothetical protein [Puia sp.]
MTVSIANKSHRIIFQQTTHLISNGATTIESSDVPPLFIFGHALTLPAQKNREDLFPGLFYFFGYTYPLYGT